MANTLTDTAVAHHCRVTVQQIRTEARDIVSVVLAAADGSLPPYEPGAHVRMTLPGGVQRSYSLCNRGACAGTYTVAVKREEQSRGGSAAVHALRVGDTLKLSGPYNHFPVDWRESPLMLVAGGIGITPIFAMAQEAMRRGHTFELHYFARDAEHAAFLNDLHAGAYGNRVQAHLGLNAEQVGMTLEQRLHALPATAGVYVCGPRPLIDLTRALCSDRLPPSAVHWESFGAEATAPAAVADDAPFDIRLLDGSGPFHVPVGQSALQVLLDAGVDVPHSCREGECGMCVLEVAEGLPEHRDHFLSAEVRESGQCMAVCVSRAKTPVIVLDF